MSGDLHSSDALVLANMRTVAAVSRMRCGPVAYLSQVLMGAMEEAIAEAQQRLAVLAAHNQACGEEYGRIAAQLARWTAARDLNR